MNPTLKELLEQDPQGLSVTDKETILRFYDLVLKENEIQNLTRLISPPDFYYGHLQDVFELQKGGGVDYPALDLGSGVGIPGLVSGLLSKKEWILSDSEKKKAEYLSRTVHILGLEKSIRVFSGRAEDLLKQTRVGSIVVRAVGPVERIYGWIRNCSTWNNLLLFKGPTWDEEWAAFKKSKWKAELKILSEHSYSTGPSGDLKQRKLVKIGRVPRGTSA